MATLSPEKAPEETDPKPYDLLAQNAVDPELHRSGFPLEQMASPTCEISPQGREGFLPALVQRGSADAGPLLELLAREEANEAHTCWDGRVAERENIPFDRPAHDRWGVGKVMLVHCDDFMKRVYHMPWWTETSEEGASNSSLESKEGATLSAHGSSKEATSKRDGDGKKPCSWREAVAPFLRALGVPPHRVVRCLLARLPVGVVIPVHHDTGFWVGRTHRMHVPIVTNEEVVFRAGFDEEGMQRYKLQVGGIYELNNQSKHYVSNWGLQARVHLIFDFVDTDALLPQALEVLHKGEKLRQTRRSIDRASHAGSRQVGPGFVIIGAQKSGTTAVYEYLHQHPLVLRGARRESHAFDWRWPDSEGKSLTQTQKLEASVGRYYHCAKLQTHPSLVSGDSTPSYLLHSDVVIPRLLEMTPWVQLIACLRDPVARAYSHFMMVVDPEGSPLQLKTRGQSHWSGKTFAEVVDSELATMEKLGITSHATAEEFKDRYLRDGALCPLGHGGHSLVARGLYALQLEPWLTHFPLASHSPLAPLSDDSHPPPPPPLTTVPGKFLAGGVEGSVASSSSSLSSSSVPLSSSSSLSAEAAAAAAGTQRKQPPFALAPTVSLPGVRPSLEESGAGGRLLVVKLEDMVGKGSPEYGSDPKQATQLVMERVFAHCGLEKEVLPDTSAKNNRDYVPLRESGDASLKAADRLRAFYAPFNANLCALLRDPSFTSAWS